MTASAFPLCGAEPTTIREPSSSPTKNAVIQGVSISGAGRQAVTMASASGVQVSDLVVLNPGINTFDIEADQHNEGADNVTIDGCTTSGGQIFFANGGAGSSANTHDFTIAHCAMARTTAGDAILSVATRSHEEASARSVQLRRRHPLLRQQRTTSPASSSRAPRRLSRTPCCTSRGQRLTSPSITWSRMRVAVFTNDRVHGYGIAGHVGPTATVKVTGGHWVLASGAGTGTGADTKQGRHQNH